MIKSHSNSTISLHYFDSIKWKKRLSRLSNKLHRSQHWNATNTYSATVMAAATEKFIRQNKSATPASQEIEIHSEDLTASQFAHLTGIKTKRNNAQQSIYSTDFSDSDSDTDEEEEDDYFSTQRTAKSYQPTSRRIWDSHFWQDGRKSLPNTTKSSSLKEIAQPLCRNKSEPGGSRVPSMVQKGRFKIVWGHEQEEESAKPIITATNCVEWKRKRACSNESVNSSSTSNMQ
jgi:hypothetical protein